MEKCDLYNIERQKVGEFIRGQKVPKGTYRLVVHICIFNSEGKLLIQQRHKDKKSWPNAWDITLGGGVRAGENSRRAATRETKEELGLDIDFETERVFMTVNFENGYDDIFVIERNVDLDSIKFVDHEVQAVRWADEKEILDMIDKGEFINYYKSFISAIFEMRKHRGVHTPV